MPLQEARLSTFLAADRNGTAEAGPDDVLEAFLSGQIIDLQSLLNVSNLVESGQRFARPGCAASSACSSCSACRRRSSTALAENLRFASDISTDNRPAGQAPLLPQRVEQLVWLGLPVDTVAALQPYVTVLPVAHRRST